MTDEHEVVRRREILAEQTEFAQAIGRHEMGVVNDGDEHFAGAMDAESLLNEETFAVMITAFELDLKGFAKDAEGVVVGVQRPVDHRCDDAFWIMGEECLFENTLAGARFAQDQAEATLLGMNFEDVEDFLLVRKQRDGFGVERMALNAKMRTDHMRFTIEDWGGSGLRSLAMGLSGLASPMRSPL